MQHHHPALCAQCGAREFVVFQDETFPLGAGGSIDGLCGWRCSACAEVMLDDVSHSRYAQASDAAVREVRKAEQQLLLRVRKKLGLTQRQAAQITGGGHNAFSRYERGEAQPMPAVVNLFKILDKHPELLAEVR